MVKLGWYYRVFRMCCFFEVVFGFGSIWIKLEGRCGGVFGDFGGVGRGVGRKFKVVLYFLFVEFAKVVCFVGCF